MVLFSRTNKFNNFVVIQCLIKKSDAVIWPGAENPKYGPVNMLSA